MIEDWSLTLRELTKDLVLVSRDWFDEFVQPGIRTQHWIFVSIRKLGNVTIETLGRCETMNVVGSSGQSDTINIWSAAIIDSR